jgi:chaperone protein EcpD
MDWANISKGEAMVARMQGKVLGAISRRTIPYFLAGMLALAAIHTHAGVSLESTRVIYKEGQRDISIKLSNNEKAKNALVQIWMDDGDPDADAGQANIPFLINPPLAKIEAGKAQVVRIAFIGEKLNPKNESVYWLNVLEIPPKSTEPSQLSFAIRSRVKFFYRPKAIQALEPLNPANLQWTWNANSDVIQIQALNTSAFHWTITSAIAVIADREYDLNLVTMISPGQATAFAVKGVDHKPDGPSRMRIIAINDFGGESKFEFEIKDAP